MNEPLLLEDELDEYFTFIEYEECLGIRFEVYLDDYGQSYHLAWINPNTREKEKWCCGTYNNNYKETIEDIANYLRGVNVV
jgi:hypothetical protein